MGTPMKSIELKVSRRVRENDVDDTSKNRVRIEIPMYTLGYDIGSSSIKCAIFDCASGRTVAHGSYPSEEMPILSPRPGWAEQDPEQWWSYVVTLTRQLFKETNVDAGAAFLTRCMDLYLLMYSDEYCDRRSSGVTVGPWRSVGKPLRYWVRSSV